MLAKTSDTRFSDRRSESERGGTGDRREKSGESRARKVQNGRRAADEIVGDCRRKSNWYFYANNQIIALKRKSQV